MTGLVCGTVVGSVGDTVGVTTGVGRGRLGVCLVLAVMDFFSF